MAKNLEEKRLYPRVKTNLNADVSKNRVKCVDFSEGGMSFDSTEIISRPSISLQVYFPIRKFALKTKAKLVWERNLYKRGSTYGVKFVGLKEKDKSTLREELIKAQIEGLLNDVKATIIKEHISYFFLESVKDYINEVIRFTSQLPEEGEYSLDTQKELERLNIEILLKGYSLSLLLSDKVIMRKIKENFRSLLGTWLYKSLLLKRAFEKSRGSPGDYMVLEAVYNNCPLSKGLGEYYDRDFLNAPYAVALRLRNDRLREMLHEFIICNAQKPSIKILSLACGSCREIAALIGKSEYKNSINFTCIDGDREALNFSKGLFKKLPANISVDFLKNDLKEMAKVEEGFKILNKQDLIYSTGLIDYLPDRVLKEWLQFFSRGLSKGGKFIVTHQNREKSIPPLSPDWFCDWEFVPRSKDELIVLLRSALADFSLDVTGDDFAYIFYFTLTKK